MKRIRLRDFEIANDKALTVIAGPCQLETTEQAIMIATQLRDTCRALGLNYIFKASFDKANRTSLSGTRGLGLHDGLAALDAVRQSVNVPVLTDVHAPEQCAPVAEVVDILQIPAFLSRQTDLLVAAAATQAVVNIKKGQFLAPWDMEHVVAKVARSGNERILLTERGASFGYNALVTDMRALPIMAKTGYPVIMDCTHSVQQPGGQGGSTGGQREFAPVMARAAVALGIAGVFIETHPDPDSAPSDGPNMVPLEQMSALLGLLAELDQLAKAHPISI